jgi:putative SOS response-associated peptidase YedK
MCGRFVQTSSPQRLALRFDAADTIGDDHRPRYNVAPSTPCPFRARRRWPPARAAPMGVRASVGGHAERRAAAHQRPQRRCRVLASVRTRARASSLHRPRRRLVRMEREDGARQPWLLRPSTVVRRRSPRCGRSGTPATRRNPTSPSLSTVALMTTEARARPRRAPPHAGDRPRRALGDWLDPRNTRRAPCSPTSPDARHRDVVTRVSRRVNDVRNDDASSSCTRRADRWVGVGRRRPISRILSPARSPGTGWRPSLWDVGLPTPRAADLGRDGRTTLSLLGLAPDGACRSTTVTRRAGGLLPHRFTLTASRHRGRTWRSALCCALHASPRLGVTQHPVLWSPDFPHLLVAGAVACPASPDLLRGYAPGPDYARARRERPGRPDRAMGARHGACGAGGRPAAARREPAAARTPQGAGDRRPGDS